MNKRTFIFNEINGLEIFDLFIDTVTKAPPMKIENRQSVPLKSGSYNFSKIIGYPIFEDREITYTCQLIENSSRELDTVLTAINKWLLTPTEAVLQDTATPDYHYIGECISVIPASNERGYTELTITFKCYPFKIYNSTVSNTEWDSICFNTDVFINTDFTIKNGDEIEIENISTTPVEFTCNGDFNTCTVSVNNVGYKLTRGKKAPFLLMPGINRITITGIAEKSSVTLSIDYVREEL
ncbi:hypothetical protein [uncultured Eubacterium sp.]|uniref:hypothetical protein n=1 Tax=uncultured Eubacterium sp. TaxID=165185 RepID=UPI002670F75B|nr:hypothetical protein [uncultured Eubacterium sp.]